MPKDDPDYEVGYRKPPVGGRFGKGQSGNPKGRPKGSRNLATIVLRESRQPVRVNGPRGSHTVTKLEATVMQLGTKAVQGDFRSQSEFISLIRMSEDAANSGAPSLTSREMDQKVMESIRRRMGRISAEITATNPEAESERSE